MASPHTQVDARWLAQKLQASTAKDLGTNLTALIDGGEIAPGTHLPTVRDFARAAGVSPGTVVAAWGRLRDTGRLTTRRRGGTVVADPYRPSASTSNGTFDWARVEMSFVTPDSGWQPDLASVLATALDTPELHAAQRTYITPELLRCIEPSWPFAAQAWNCVGGGTEALVLATAAAVGGGPGPGTRDRGMVAVEEPVSPGYLDIVRHLGIEPVGIAADAEGPICASLASALQKGATAVILQPSGSYALNGALTAARAEELADVIDRMAPETWVIEDDSAGPLADAEPVTLGTHLPVRTIRIRSYCKAFGIDLRSAVLGGSAELVDRTIRLRSFGMASNSRILQNALAHLVSDDAVSDLMRRTRLGYRRRRETALDAFAGVGLDASSGANGFVVWVRVPDETSTLINLARQGIVVAAGAKSFVSTADGLLRISILQLPDEPERVAELARAVRNAVHSAEREYFD